MSYDIDFSAATSDQIEAAICRRLADIRLSRNTTQQHLAEESGVSPRTIRRLEKGSGVSVDTFIRVLTALGIQQNLESLLPDPTVRPFDRIRSGTERMRARPAKTGKERSNWSWGDGKDDDEQ
jgi:putative transcriptional regulator